MDSPGGSILIFAILALVVNIMILSWVYNDAETNGNSGCLWAFLVFFFGIWALAVYLFFIKGPSAAPHRSSVDRSSDLQYRAQSRGSGQFSEPTPIKADASYYDPELDRMIENGDFKGAREYLRDMQKMAREMNDSKALANYAAYEQRIARAASKAPTRLQSKKDPWSS
ncbi:MAG: hypothetical protein ABIC40_00675 [bacterium]